MTCIFLLLNDYFQQTKLMVVMVVVFNAIFKNISVILWTGGQF